jgi:pimeloyl-ACP methyl ester carboxylesterase
MVTRKNEAVILLHGLGLHSLFMKKIEYVLHNAGYDVYNIDYPSRQYAIDPLTEYLYEKLKQKPLDTYKRVHFIGHSLGGILIRNLLSKHRFINCGKVIALAPPNRGSILVDRLRNFTVLRWYFGPSVLQLGSNSRFLEQLQYIPDDYYVIAGNRSAGTLFGSWFDEPNDGAVSLQSTVAAGMEDSHRSIFEVTHFTIMYNKKVIDKILGVLK